MTDLSAAAAAVFFCLFVDIAVVQHQAPATAETKELGEVKKGKGTSFGDIENVEKAIGVLKATDPAITKLYSLCFPGFRAVKTSAKKTLRKFSGFTGVDVKEAKAAAVEKLGKATVVMYADFCAHWFCLFPPFCC